MAGMAVDDRYGDTGVTRNKQFSCKTGQDFTARLPVCTSLCDYLEGLVWEGETSRLHAI